MTSFKLDVRTLLVMFTMIRLAQSAAMFHVWNTHRQYFPARNWAIGSFMAAIGVMLIGFRDLISVLTSVVAGNALTISGWMIIDFGIIQAAESKPPWRSGTVITAVSIASIFWFSIIEPDYIYRLLTFTMTASLFDFLAVYACLKNQNIYNKSTSRILAVSIIVIIISSLIRLVNGFKIQESSILSPDMAQAQYFAVLIVFNIIITVMLVLLTAQKLQRELDVMAKQLIRQSEVERDYAKIHAMTDGLTKIANRRQFDESLNIEFYRLKRSGGTLSLIMLDIDHFKNYNDACGHLAGDDCLKHVALTLKSVAARAHDVVARYGGEEFTVILPETDSKTAAILAEKIRKSVEDLSIPHPESDTSEVITVSIGVVTVLTSGFASPDSIIALADEALYQAKDNGRNRVEIAEAEIFPTPESNLFEHTCVHLVWHSANECGNTTIDEQHKKLFETCNRLLSAIIETRPKTECIRIMESLMNDIVRHFHDEEEIMRSAGYPSAEDHHLKHQALADTATGLVEKYMRDELNPGEIFSFIAYDVVAQHMLIEDRKFFPYVMPQ